MRLNIQTNKCHICGREYDFDADGNRSTAGHEDCKRKEQQDIEADFQRQKFIEFTRMLAASGVPEGLLQKMRFETFVVEPGLKEAFESMRDWTYPNPFGYLLCGSTGTGKTHLAIALINKLVRQGVTCQYVKFNLWIDKLRASPDLDQVESEMIKLDCSQVVILDDLGAEKVTEWSEAKLERILTSRLEKERPIFITTNLSEQGFASKFPERILSRIVGLCTVIEMQAEDKRVVPLKVPQRHIVTEDESLKFKRCSFCEGTGAVLASDIRGNITAFGCPHCDLRKKGWTVWGSEFEGRYTLVNRKQRTR